MNATSEDPIQFPRTYTMDPSTIKFFHRLSIFLIALFASLTLLNLAGIIRPSRTPLDLMVTNIPAAALAILVYVGGNRRVTLYENSIEVREWGRARKLRREEILGRRMGKLPKQVGSGSYYIMVPADPGNKEMKLPPLLHVDKLFHAWMNNIPKLNHED
jgi:hypothetical protein